MAIKPYRPKTLTGAARMVANLRRQLVMCDRWLEANKRRIESLEAEANALAKLAATGPAFFNTLEIMAAKKLRDDRLATMNMNPDGSFKHEPTNAQQ